VLCASFEALVGALFLDQDLEAVKELLFPLVEPVLPELAAAAAAKDAKSRLQEWSQSQFRATPHYHTENTKGPEHAKVFTVQVKIRGDVWGVGHGKSKQIASQEAATDALRYAEAHINEETILPPAAYQANDALEADELTGDSANA
jgi:ribonuclease-3